MSDYFHHDAAERPSGVARDCTVRALTIVTGCRYATAEAIAHAAGRRRNRGFRSSQLIDAARAEGFNFEEVKLPQNALLAEVLLILDEGRFYVRVRGHAFAIVDGKVHDMFHTSLRTPVRGAWRFTTRTRKLNPLLELHEI